MTDKATLTREMLLAILNEIDDGIRSTSSPARKAVLISRRLSVWEELNPQEKVRTALYRHFSADGRLLYVGISLCAIGRLAQHRQTAHWFGEISRVDVEWLPSRRDALKAEAEAIRKESPMHNIAGQPQAMQPFGDVIDGIGEYLADMYDVVEDVGA